MGLRLQNTIYDGEGQDWRISVYDSTYSSSVFPIDITKADIQYQNSTAERFAPIMASVAQISFRVDGAVLNTFVSDFIGAAEKRFRLTIEKGTDLFWVGNIQTDNVRKQDKEYPYIFTIRAADGLASLKDVDYNDAGTAYSGTATLAEHLCLALSKIGTSDLFGDFLAVNNNWFSDQHLTTSEVYNTSKLDHRLFIDIDSTGTKNYKSAHDVIEFICVAFGAKIFIADGVFNVVQINSYEGGTYALNIYNSSGVPGTPIASTSYRLTDGSNIIRLGGGSYQYYPALNKVVVRYTHYQAQSIIPADSVNSTLFSIENVDSGGGTSTILLRTDYEAETNFTGAYIENRIKFGVQIKIGSKYLYRPATISQAGAISYGTAIWTNTLSYVEYFTNPLLEGAPVAFTATAILNSPPIPADGQMDIVGQYLETVDNTGLAITPGTFSSTISFFNSYLEIVPAGVLSSRANETIYISENSNTNNSKKLEIKTSIGSAPSFNALGAIQVLSGINYVNPAGWAVGAVGVTTPIGQVLATEIIKTQLKPVEIIAATYHGFASPLNTIYKGATDYAARQLTVDLIEGTTQGLWFGCDSTGASLIEKSPDPIFETDEDISPFTPRSVIVKNPNAESETNPEIKTFAQKQRIFTTDADVTEGSTVTTIQVEPSGVNGIIKSGDTFEIIDTITGLSQTFTATADVSGTDTSISVTSTTADFDFSTGSAITFSQESLVQKISTGSAGVSSLTGGTGIDTDVTTGAVTASLNLSELTNYIGPSGADYIAGYRQSTGGNATWQLFDLVHSILASSDASVTITTTGASVNLSVNFPIEAVTVGDGLDISGTATRNITLNFTELLTSAGFDYNDYLAGHTSGGTMARTNVLDMFANMITAGTNVTVTNTGTQIQIAASGGGGGITAITTSDGLDNSGTSTVNISLDLSELPLSAGFDYNDYLAGTTSAGTESRTNVLDMFANMITAGTNVTVTNTGTQIQISSTGSSSVDGDANWDDTSVNLQYVDFDMSSTVISSTHSDKRHFVIGATVSSSATSDTLISLPTASITYNHHEIWVGCSDNSTSYNVEITSGSVVKTLTDGELVCVKCLRLGGSWYWIST